MSREDFKRLDRGAIVRHKSLGDSYVVTANYGDRVTAVRSVDLTNPDEWEVVYAVLRYVVGSADV